MSVIKKQLELIKKFASSSETEYAKKLVNEIDAKLIELDNDEITFDDFDDTLEGEAA